MRRWTTSWGSTGERRYLFTWVPLAKPVSHRFSGSPPDGPLFSFDPRHTLWDESEAQSCWPWAGAEEAVTSETFGFFDFKCENGYVYVRVIPQGFRLMRERKVVYGDRGVEKGGLLGWGH